MAKTIPLLLSFSHVGSDFHQVRAIFSLKGFCHSELDPVTESVNCTEPSLEGHLLFEHPRLSAGNHNFLPRLEPNQKSTVGPPLNAFQEPKVDNCVTVCTKKHGWVEALVHVAETPRHHGTTPAEIYARAIAFRFEQDNVGDSNDPATLTVLDENTFGTGDPLANWLPDRWRWGDLLRYKGQRAGYDALRQTRHGRLQVCSESGDDLAAAPHKSHRNHNQLGW